MTMAAQSVQMNVRIDEALKKSGDRVLKLAGFSPSEAVRRLWGIAAQNAADPTVLEGILSAEYSARDTRHEENPKLLKLRQGRELMAEARRELGIKVESLNVEESYGDMRDAYLYERLEERGLA